MKKWEEYKFRIDTYTPDTLPMARCAEYLTELATILGETPYVHFVKVASGSASLAYKVDIEAVPKVTERTSAVKAGTGTSNQMQAYRKINKMLQENNATGTLKKGRSKLLYFPGREEDKDKISAIQQRGEIDGEVIRVGGAEEIVPILLKSEGMVVSGCRARRTVAKELAKHLFETVRLYGEGRWERNADGIWNLVSFFVDRFDELQEKPIFQTILALRELKGEWKENALEELLRSRHGEEDIN